MTPPSPQRRPPRTPPSPEPRNPPRTPPSPIPPPPPRLNSHDRRALRARRPMVHRPAPYGRRSISQGPGRNNDDWGSREYGKYAERLASTELKKLHLEREDYKQVLRVVANAAKTFRFDDFEVRSHLLSGYRFYMNGEDANGTKQFSIPHNMDRPPAPRYWIIDNEVRSNPPSPVFRPEASLSPSVNVDYGEGSSNQAAQMFEPGEDQTAFYRRLLAGFAAQGRTFGQREGEIPAIYGADGLLTEWGYELHLLNQARQLESKPPLVHYEEVGFDRKDDDETYEPYQGGQAQPDGSPSEYSPNHVRRGPKTPPEREESVEFSPGHIPVGPKTPPMPDESLEDDKRSPIMDGNQFEEMELYPMDPEQEVSMNFVPVKPQAVVPEQVASEENEANPMEVDSGDLMKLAVDSIDQNAAVVSNGSSTPFSVSTHADQIVPKIENKRPAVQDLIGEVLEKKKAKSSAYEKPEEGEIVDAENAGIASSKASKSADDKIEILASHGSNSILKSAHDQASKASKSSRKRSKKSKKSNETSSSSSDERLIHSQSPPTPQNTTSSSDVSSSSSGGSASTSESSSSAPSAEQVSTPKKSKKNKEKRRDQQHGERSSRETERLENNERPNRISSANSGVQSNRSSERRQGNNNSRRRGSHGAPRSRNSNGRQQGQRPIKQFQGPTSHYSKDREREINMHLARMVRDQIEREGGEALEPAETEYSHFAHDTSGRGRHQQNDGYRGDRRHRSPGKHIAPARAHNRGQHHNRGHHHGPPRNHNQDRNRHRNHDGNRHQNQDRSRHHNQDRNRRQNHDRNRHQSQGRNRQQDHERGDEAHEEARPDRIGQAVRR